MRIRRASTGQFITLSDSALLGAGGEARIYAVPQDPGLVAKIWHKPTDERARKIQAMLANPPSDPTAALRHVSIAWPTDSLYDASSRRIIGFLMPRIAGLYPAIDFFNPKSRRQRCPLFNYFYLHRAARNLAITVKALHERGCVLGDVNESNILVSDTALVTIVDTDSFQVADHRDGTVYRCRVGKPEFTPPEMHGISFAEMDRTPVQDYFGLAVLIFQFLMEGTHPFAGAYLGKGEAPPYEQRILAGHFPYSGDLNVPYRPKPAAPPFELLHPNLRHLFLRCFQDGHFSPSSRPDPTSWQYGIEEAEHALVTCAVNEQHVYGEHHEKCPWCERTKLLGGRDPFPSARSVKAGAHLLPAPTAAVPYSTDRTKPPIAKPVPPWKPPAPPKDPFAFLTHRRNDWAWLGLGFSVLGVPAFFWSPLLGFLLGVFGVFSGAVGALHSLSWSSDGRGRKASVVAMVLGTILATLYLNSFRGTLL